MSRSRHRSRRRKGGPEGTGHNPGRSERSKTDDDGELDPAAEKPAAGRNRKGQEKERVPRRTSNRAIRRDRSRPGRGRIRKKGKAEGRRGTGTPEPAKRGREENLEKNKERT
ncbi:hypothetical protein C922_05084 [Plasmodium inui San Antonio 1]|uniref:Uncharacterized protein n=1 Tax=Plasmodium inui San Antonio 1 TaxID=1237626 RepID=W6ZUU0_9APIC|nr:hypothetical protein C922_05084 [Plasmodium inui San Antonio 1]EUD64522.1 hypothetical protein C922_05084 [Plasmodium inui San Antonio 1]